MTKKPRTRIDYMPGEAAQQALKDAAGLMPSFGTQALIDKLILVGLSALTHEPWKPPALYGKNRDKWLYRPQDQPNQGKESA